MQNHRVTKVLRQQYVLGISYLLYIPQGYGAYSSEKVDVTYLCSMTV